MPENAITINVKKTKHLIIGSKELLKKTVVVKLQLQNEYQEIVPTYKYLGIYID